MRHTVTRMVCAVFVTGLIVALSGCFTIPKGTMSQVKVGSVELKAVGAGIVKADAQTTTFRIKCRRCGYEAKEMTIPTPVPGKPYILNWVCPRCGNKQQIVIEVVSPQ